MKKRILSVLLCLCMVVGLLPTTALADEHQHCICGSSTHTEEGHEMKTFEAWTSATALPSEANKAYYLTDNVTLSGTWTVPNNTVLCLNGKTITANGDFAAITVGDSVAFTLTDCATTQGKITHTAGANGRGVENNGTFKMYGGNINGNSYNNSSTNQSYGGGVYNGGTFHLYGGTISGNKVSGSGVYGAGVYNNNGQTFNMYGGTICDNEAGPGSAQYTGKGGGVYNAGTFTMTGGTISGNKALQGGGVITQSLSSTAAFTMSGGEITGNTVKGPVQDGDGAWGGGVAVRTNYGTFTVSGSAQVTGNTKIATDRANKTTVNNVYLQHFTTRTITVDTMTSGAEIGVTSGGGTTLREGNPVIVSNANANNGSYVSYFTSDDPAMALTCNTDNQLQLKMKTTYTVTSSGTSNGSFVVDVKDSESNDRAVADAAVTIVPTPDSGYEVGTVTVTGADSSPVSVSNTDNTYTFTMPAQAVTVSVTFRSSTPTTHNVTFAGGDGANGTGPDVSSHNAGDSVNLPLPTGHSFTKENYTFIGWSDGTHSYLPGAAYTMPDHDVTLTALWTASNPHAETKVTIAGKELNSTNAYYHNGTRDNLNGTADNTAAGASAYFKDGVLVLNGLNVNNGQIKWEGSISDTNDTNDDLIIVLLSGSVNTVTNTSHSAIVGTGTLYESGPCLTVRTSGNEDAMLYAVSKDASGLWIWQDTTIEDHAKVIAQGNKFGIAANAYTNGSNTAYSVVTIQGNADVKAVGGSYGIYADNSHQLKEININGGQLLAQGGTKAMQIEPTLGSGIQKYNDDDKIVWVGTTGTTRATKPTAEFTATSTTSGVLSGLTTDMQYKLGYSDWVKITSGMLTGGAITLTDLPSSGLTISVQNTKNIDTTNDDSDVLVLTPVMTVPTYGILLSQTVPYTFPGATVGYDSAPAAKSVTVTNTGTNATVDLTVALTGENATEYFTLSTNSLNSIAVGGHSDPFTVQPKTGLAAGTYTATVTVSGGSGISATFNVSFTVAPALGYSISLSADGSALSGSDTVNFGTETVGYDSAPAAKSVTVTNTGTNATGALTVALTDGNTDAFEVLPSSISSITNTNGTADFTVQPKTGLAAGTYTATVTVSGGSGIESKSFNVSFTVNPLGELETVTFNYAYDAQRDIYYPAKDQVVNMTDLVKPVDANGDRDTLESAGSWKLSKVGTYSYARANVQVSSYLSGIVSGIARAYHVSNPDSIVIHELKKDDAHIAYGVVVAYDAAGGYAMFLGDTWSGGACYLLSMNAMNAISGTSASITAGSILTDFIPTAPSGFTLTPNGTYTFPGAIVGYGAQTPLTVTVTNTGSQETGELQVTLGSDKFTLSGLTDGKISSIPATPSSNTATFKVVPNTGLAPGSYIAQVNVSNGSVVQTLTVTFTVTRAATTNTISLSVDGSPLTGTYTFPGATVGYGAQNALEVTVTNTGATATNRLDLRTSGDAGQFELSPITLGSLAPGGATRFTVTPKTGLAANYYTLEIMVYDSRNSEVLATLQVTFTVTSSSGGGGGNYNPSYKVDTQLPDDVDGTVSAKTSTAKKGDTVTITVTPDPYYKVDGVVVKDQNGKALDVTDHGDGTFTFKMPSSKVTVEPIFSWDNPFVDVTENAYYTPAVEWALKNGITGGSTAATFSPDAACTRAQAVTFLWRAAGSPAPKSSAMPFNDVAADAYYYDAVLWAVEQGITAGASDTAFNPNAICTRAQIVTFLWRAEASLAAAIANPFVDVPADAYYADAVSWAVENGITSGTSATTFSPAADCTRAQILMFLYRDVIQ